MTNELLPCPFCGGEANLITWHEHTEARHIQCTQCMCMTGEPHFSRESAYRDWNTRATPQIDVEKLKREVCETVTHNIQKVGAVYAVNVVSDIIDHLAAQYDFVPKNGGNTRAPLPRIDGLYDAISIEDILAPNTDKECDNIVKRYNDHRAIYGRDSSETLLEAARAYAKLQGGKE